MVMKKTFVILFLFFCFQSRAQDTTKVYNLSLSARLIEYLAPAIANPDNDENFDVFLKWRKIYRSNPPSVTGSVITDTIPVSTIAFMYTSLLQGQEGFALSPSFKTALNTARNSNNNLDRQLTAIETAFTNQTTTMRMVGRRLLTGK